MSSDQRVADSKVFKTTALQGYALAEYPDGLDKEPTYLPWVAQYITHFRDVIQPRYCTLSPHTLNPFPMFLYVKQHSISRKSLPIWFYVGLPIHRGDDRSAAAKDLTILCPFSVPVEKKDPVKNTTSNSGGSAFPPLYERCAACTLL